jgi:hypothetical protein
MLHQGKPGGVFPGREDEQSGGGSIRGSRLALKVVLDERRGIFKWRVAPDSLTRDVCAEEGVGRRVELGCDVGVEAEGVGAGVDAEGTVLSVELVELISVELPVVGGGREAAAGTGVSGTGDDGCGGRRGFGERWRLEGQG